MRSSLANDAMQLLEPTVSQVIVPKLARRRAALIQSVTMLDLVGRIDLGDLAALPRIFQGCRSLFQAAIAVALNGVAILVDLEKRQVREFVPSFEHVSLSVVEKKIKSTAGSFPHNSHSGLTKVLGARHFGGEQAALQMRLLARLSSAKRAPLSGFGQTHGATHSQYLSRRKFFGDYHRVVRSRWFSGDANFGGLPWHSALVPAADLKIRDDHPGLLATAFVEQGNEIRQNADSSLLPPACDGCHPRC